MSKNVNKTNKIVSRLAAEKKKTIIAVCLITVMVFMWARMLGGKKPQAANAAMMSQAAEADTAGQNSQLKISFIQLPVIEGRNDVLTRDFFDVGDWQDFINGSKGQDGSGKVRVVSKSANEQVIRQVTGKLKLSAVALGKNPQAFINDKLMLVGDKLLINDGINAYECEVIGIEGKTVLIRCGEVQIRLKLAEVNEDS